VVNGVTDDDLEAVRRLR